MLNYSVRRLLLIIPLLLAISVLIFLILKLTPGDPAAVLLGERANEEAIRLIRAKYALDQPLFIQYWKMITNFFTGELKSIYYKENVISIVLQRLPATLELGLTSLVLAVIVAIPAGIISAVKRNTIFDYISMVVSLLGVSIPAFYFGILLIYLFGVNLKILPVSGYGGHIWTLEGFKHMIMPAFVLAFSLMASTTRLTRSSVLDVLKKDYMRTAKAKGVSKNKIIIVHGLRNSLIPIVTNIGNQIVVIFAGAIITETVFSWPGLGRLAVNAIFRRDEPLVFGAVLILAIVFVVVNLFIDLLYAFINPQIKYD